MVINLGNGSNNPSSNPGQSCLHLPLHQCPWERHKSLLTPNMGK